MSFLGMSAAQAIALALATAGVIVALYFVKLRRRRMMTSSLLLWQTVLEQRQARSIFEKLRNPLSLALALAIGLLLALALARPEVEALTGKRKRVTIVLDTSPSMLARAGNETRWQRAVREALALLDEGGASTEFRIEDTSGYTDTTYSADRSELRKRIAEMRPRAADLRFPATDVSASAAGDTETWFISDGVANLTVPAGAQRISVFEEAPNVGIVAFEIRSEPSSPLHYTAYLEIQNYGKNPTAVTISIAGAEDRKITRQTRLDAGGRFQEAFDLSIFPGGPVTVTAQSEGDAFDLDDRAFAYIPVERKTRTLLVTKGNRYLEAALKLDARVDLKVTDPASFQEADDIDAYVFDRFAPDTQPARPALVIGAPRAPWLPPTVGTVPKPSITTRLDSHPVIQHVALHDLSIREAAKIDSAGLVAVASSNGAPLIAASDEEGRVKWVLLTFPLEASDFPFQAGFPVFIDNTLAWFSREPLALGREPGLIHLPFRDATVETADGSRVEARTVLDETVFEAQQPGLYVATYGKQRQRVAINLASRDLSNINRATASGSTNLATARPLLRRELWFYMIVAALALLVIEWFTYHRRITL